MLSTAQHGGRGKFGDPCHRTELERSLLRSRIVAAAVGAAALGVSAALVPTVSTAGTVAGTTASPVVQWKDAADDFTRVSPTGDVPLDEDWYWAPLAADGDAESITDVAALDEDGLSVSAGDAVGLVHGLSSPVDGAGLSDLVADAAVDSTGAVGFGLAVQEAGTDTAQQAVIAVGGLQGDDTEWSRLGTSGSATESTADLAAELTDAGDEVVGYVLYVGFDPTTGTTPTPGDGTTPGDGATTPPAAEPTADPTTAPADPTTPPAAEPTADPTTPPADGTEPVGGTEPVALLSQSERLAADASAAVSAVRVGDTTSYFTPQPTAAATAGQVPLAQAVSGFQVSGTGFAPNEVVAASVSQGDQTSTDETNASVADEDGNVVVTVRLPEGAATAGAYSVTLLGASSGQTATASSVFVADGTAPVAVPVPGRATFTG